MIFKVPEKTKEKLKQINLDIDKLESIRQTIADTICDMNNYSGQIRLNENGDIETMEGTISSTETIKNE